MVQDFFAYDHTGRLRATRQQVGAETQPVLLARRRYNEVGQLVVDSLATGALAQAVDYAYNPRGWLTGLNNPHAPDPADLFNLSLHYERGFTRGYEQYSGNLTGQTWRGRDGVQRAYGYAYDPLNRLLRGDFVARAGALAPTPGAWNAEEDRFRLFGLGYDDNGNIGHLQRRGLLAPATRTAPARFGAVDQLAYTYQGNRLQAVDDQITGNQLPRPTGYNGAPASRAGDFQEQGVKLGQEYSYDASGNLTADKNKGITRILYNHLNLPRQVKFGAGADSVVFRYAADGQKVAKLVYQTGKPTPQRTDYLAGFQYEADSLRFFAHAAGRVLRSYPRDPAGQVRTVTTREYTVSDHLGNLRLAYRPGQRLTYKTSLNLGDADQHGREVRQFDSLSVSAPVAQQVGSLSRTDTYVARLNAGGSAPQPLGPLKQLAVQKGDTITLSAYALYPQAEQQSFWFSLASFLTGLLQPAAGQPAPPEAVRRGGLPLLQIGVAAGLTGLDQLPGGVPKGYLRLLVFNSDSVLVGQQVQQITSLALNNYQPRSLQLIVPQDGYVTAYVANESAVDVFFDDVSVELRQGLQIQETQYDPTGLELAGLPGSTPGLKPLNQYKFNGKEFQTDLGLSWNHQDWRFFDAQLGRWHSVDRKAEEGGQESWSTYQFGFNNALRYSDPDGECPPCIIAAMLAILSTAMPVNAPGLNQEVNQRQMAEAKASYDNGMLGALMPAGTIRTGWSAINGARNVANRFEKAAEARENGQIPNAKAGALREKAAQTELEKANPGASVQRERFLRDSNGKIAKDPVSGEGRRIDHAVIKDGTVTDLVETTSLTAPKGAQAAKEARIREAGGTYIRDKETRKLHDVKEVPTRLERRD
ncbi:RHS repeat-associated core domain-containing protein [Hymenobacter humi]|uniref:RHS repeat-associated core domain-containing protein n=1 Tax=Hymenobacter humi TaxID=1411620 RepID=A0ABW2UBU9_9BACT